MIPDNEFNRLSNKLDSERVNGNVDFINKTKEIKNGNTYLRVECTRKSAAKNIKSLYESMYNHTYVEFDKIQNLKNDNIYVYFVMPNYKIKENNTEYKYDMKYE